MNQPIVPHSDVSFCFLGYDTLEEWASGCSPLMPVYAMEIATTSTSNSGCYHVQRFHVCVQQRDSQGVIHYWQTETGTVDWFGSRANNPELAEKTARCESLWPLVRQWLTEAGYTLTQATFATPKNLTLLHGSLQAVCFDKAANRWVFREEAYDAADVVDAEAA